ncbi:MAG TPA: outer membrane beta-barrel protein [Gammaproteobacteria bacterium]|nr:outer membrane beta-barrel protein [Gammaproteobacteria bacterium]
MDAKITLLAAGLLMFTGTAQATELNYDYIEVSYSEVDFDDFDEDLTGVTIGGSFLVSEEIFVYGAYSDGETDSFGGGRIAVSGYSLGLGYRFGVSPQTDVNFGAAFERAKVEGKGAFSGLGSDSENGYSLSVGVRHLVTRDFELGADVTYVDIDTDDTVLTLGGLWHVTDLVAVGLGYFVGSDASGFEGGVRFKF